VTNATTAQRSLIGPGRIPGRGAGDAGWQARGHPRRQVHRAPCTRRIL